MPRNKDCHGNETLAPSAPCSFPNKRGRIKAMGVLWSSEEGQDVAEYAVMLAVILILIIGLIRMIGSNANNVFSSVGSNLQ